MYSETLIYGIGVIGVLMLTGLLAWTFYLDRHITEANASASGHMGL